MTRIGHGLCFALCVALPAFAGEPESRSPFEVDAARAIPLRIEIETSLDFSRVAHGDGQGGEVVVDQNGGRQVKGGLVGLGGMALRGSVRVTGQPNALIRVDLPRRVSLHASNGAVAEVVDLKTDLSTLPRLDGAGNLNFSFGGRLLVKGQISGIFRGNVPINIDYQ